MADVDQLLAEAAVDVQTLWPRLEEWLRQRFGREPGLESVLFLVGVQARGTGYTPQLEKDEKQELIMLGSYVVLSTLGVYEKPLDDAGEPEWSRIVDIPRISIDQQESLLKLGAVRYFEQFMDTP